MTPPALTNPSYPPEATQFRFIAASLRPRLSSYCGIDANFVYPVANDKYAVTIAEDFFLYYQFFGIDAFGDSGGGRLNPWATRRLRVYIYTRSGVDIFGEDEVALQGGSQVVDPNPPMGQFTAEELVLGALFNWMPLDSDTGKALLPEPIHPADGSGPPLRKAEDDEGLIRTNLDFSIRYNLAIDRTDPAT